MGDTGSPYNLPYPELADTPDVPADIQSLAETVDTELARIDAATAEETPYAKYTRSTSQTIPNATVTDVVFNVAEVEHDDVDADSPSTPTVFTLNRAGVWLIAAQVSFSANNSNSRLLFITDTTGTPFYGQTQVTAVPSVETICQALAVERFTVGQTIKCRVRQLSTVSLTLVADLAQVTFTWMGP